MNNSIVKLHNRKDNSVILVDLDTVILIDSLDEDGKAQIPLETIYVHHICEGIGVKP